MSVAVAVNDQGRREVLGMAIGASEAETFWTEFLRSLARRGLRGVKLLISDDHKGLKAAAMRILGATWQRCRDALRPQPAGPCRPPGPARRLRLRRHRLRPGGRRQREGPVASGCRPAQRPRCPSWQLVMDEAEHYVLAYMTFPKVHR